MTDTTCSLCKDSSGTVARGRLWTAVLNANQALLGRTYFKLNRHETNVGALEVAEQTELFEWFAVARRALDSLFAPDHYNYVLLMNVEPHVHAHIIPRYASPRNFESVVFTDSQFGNHYDPDAAQFVPGSKFDALATAMGNAMSKESRS